MLLFIQYFVLLARFLRGQLQPPQLALIDEILFVFLSVGAPVFSLSCSLKSLAKIRRIYILAWRLLNRFYPILYFNT
ncbi:hypothetical protein [Staphylococcus sp. HMSC061C10]|uniref:hypothetical protein n=1 Tax=Staphylococcus sp. HMSC061C10 TaxID=1715056 RepID=UPI00210B6F6B|nr:hypothetical protein [Staphylococcus sp. HMSC061C10]